MDTVVFFAVVSAGVGVSKRVVSVVVPSRQDSAGKRAGREWLLLAVWA